MQREGKCVTSVITCMRLALATVIAKLDKEMDIAARSVTVWCLGICTH